MSELNDQQAERYSRHILLRQIGVRGQERLLASRVFVVGAGGLGSAALIYLSAAGVGRLGIVDSDRVELSNLSRQILHTHHDLGKDKVQSALEAISAINPESRVDAFPERLTVENIDRVIKGYEVVLDGSDNFATRFLVADYCRLEQIPLVSAAVTGFEGQLLSVRGQPGHPCYRCFIPETPDAAPTCAEAGVLGPAVGVMGTLQAVEAIKVLLGIGENLFHHLLIYHALTGEFRRVRRPLDPQCPLCGPHPTITRPGQGASDVECTGSAVGEISRRHGSNERSRRR